MPEIFICIMKIFGQGKIRHDRIPVQVVYLDLVKDFHGIFKRFGDI